MTKINSEAIFLVKKGGAEESFERRNLSIDRPEGDDVLIETEAFGLNYADVMARRGLYREAPPMPCVVGYEVVGRIVEVGENVPKEAIGSRVVAFCRFGGYAKHVVTQYRATAVINELPAQEAMALCTQAVTAYYMAEYLSPIRSGENVLIHAAAGGVGTILIQLAKLRGATVYAKIGDEKKATLVKSLGADYVINYKKSDYAQQLKSILKDERLDVSYNPVAGSTFKKDMSLIGSGGRLVLFGGSELTSAKFGIFSQLNFLKKMGLILPVGLMMRSKNVLGVNMLKIADNKPDVLAHCLREVVRLHSEGALVPQVGGIFPAAEIAKAHDALESGVTTGKLSVFW